MNIRLKNAIKYQPIKSIKFKTLINKILKILKPTEETSLRDFLLSPELFVVVGQACEDTVHVLGVLPAGHFLILSGDLTVT